MVNKSDVDVNGNGSGQQACDYDLFTGVHLSYLFQNSSNCSRYRGTECNRGHSLKNLSDSSIEEAVHDKLGLLNQKSIVVSTPTSQGQPLQ